MVPPLLLLIVALEPVTKIPVLPPVIELKFVTLNPPEAAMALQPAGPIIDPLLVRSSGALESIVCAPTPLSVPLLVQVPLVKQAASAASCDAAATSTPSATDCQRSCLFIQSPALCRRRLKSCGRSDRSAIKMPHPKRTKHQERAGIAPVYSATPINLYRRDMASTFFQACPKLIVY